MSNHPHANMPAKTVLTRAIYIPTAITVVMAVYFAVTGEWPLAIFFTVFSLSAFVTYPYYKRQLAARDADAGSADTSF